MKKYATIWLATAIATIMSMPGYAATTWFVDPSGYENGVNNGQWAIDENAAQFEKFANDNLATVNAAGSDTEKIKTAIKLVTDYMSYDERYINLMVDYVMRDHKGVCQHYAYMLQALLNKAGLTTYSIGGSANNGVVVDDHRWNIVKANGTAYWVDPTWCDTPGKEAVYTMSETLWGDHYIDDASVGITANTYVSKYPTMYTDSYKRHTANTKFIEDGGKTPDFTKAPAGTEPIVGRSGKTVYVTKADADAFVNGTLTPDQLIAKYPDLG